MLVRLSNPLFEALVEDDAKNKRFRSRAKLAFALKDKADASNEDLKRAREYIDEAIVIRKKNSEKVKPTHEYCRAILSILLDKNNSIGKPSDNATQKAIVEDLDVATKSADLRKTFTEAPIRDWLQRNSIKLAPDGALGEGQAGMS